jgi:DIM1 family U5 snRNP protein
LVFRRESGPSPYHEIFFRLRARGVTMKPEPPKAKAIAAANNDIDTTISTARAQHRFFAKYKMAYLLPHLHSGWEVDQAIVTEEDRVVIIRFGRDSDPTCMVQDEILMNIAEKVKNFAVIYVVDLDEVTDFSGMYELYDPCTTMFFYRNKHIMVDLGTGDNNKINWALADKQEFIDIIEVVYRGARKGRGLVVAPKDYSTKYRY